MDYFFILGNHPLLSMAELLAVLPTASEPRLCGTNALVLNLGQEINIPEFLTTVGGTIKAGVIETNLNRIAEATDKGTEVLSKFLPATGKFSFGVSSYGQSGPVPKIVGMTIKNKLRDKGVSCRWVTSRETTLSSVVVEQNKLLSASGRELVFLTANKKTLVGVTQGVQPFKDLSQRDYGRPARDDQSGMLPPKLAQIMLNLAGAKKDDLILDPFCGSGTILTEAMLMDYKNIFGSDISAKAVADSKINIDWVAKRYDLKNSAKLKQADAKDLATLYKPNSVGAVVAEVYLGPQRGALDVKKLNQELGSLYDDCLEVIYKILKPGARVVLALPIFKQGGKLNLLPLDINDFSVVNDLPDFVKDQTGLTPRDTFVYGRENQSIYREIIVLKK